MRRKTISVVVPVYNVAPWLPCCIDSLVNQTIPFDEIILVDDGSCDDSGEICDSYGQGHKEIRVLHQNNSGLSEARNRGIALVESDYFMLVDSDDYIAPDSVEKLSELLAKSDYDGIYFDGESFNSDGEEKEIQRYVWRYDGYEESTVMSGRDFFVQVYPEHYTICAWLQLYRTSFYRDYGFSFPKGLIHEDIALMYKYMDKADRVTYLSHTIYNRRYRPGSIMTDRGMDSRRHLRDASRVLNMNFSYICDQCGDEDEEHRRSVRQYLKWTCWYMMAMYDEYIGKEHKPNEDVMSVIEGAGNAYIMYSKELSMLPTNTLYNERMQFLALFENGWIESSSLEKGLSGKLSEEIRKRCRRFYGGVPLECNNTKIGIYGCGKHTDAFLDTFEAVCEPINAALFFIETDPNNAWYRGNKVYGITELPVEPDVIVISSKKYQDELYEIALHYYKEGIVRRLYENPPFEGSIIWWMELCRNMQIGEWNG